MRWVKLTLPPPLRPRNPLMTRRLTSSSLAGTLRKLVAVGTARLRSMFATTAAPAPRLGSPGSPAGVEASGGGVSAATAAGAREGGGGAATADGAAAAPLPTGLR